ncbi:uncharacterized protein N7483_004107 [Penicillium malachiteum]|uniref:uncharacterized protein n=1 Tax=Penicillium malachiteum TaxID=1324776 RepID=UPI002547C697|nr:uncharacterized protein N7483_004107 [Penicillium malachiteum]KAJ5729599.1 hypothetical protein N7483_004107 [Penicillium malachiteum]
MKILCLHGFGTNAYIMKQQMGTLFKYCNPKWRFVFLEAELECPPAHGAAKYPPPYFTWSTELDPTSIRGSCDLVKKAFEEQGPFDGVLGYSLGATVIISYLLEQITRYPQEPLPIKFGFFCAPVPIITGDVAYSESVYGSLSPEDLQRLRSADLEQLDLLPEPARTTVYNLIHAAGSLESTLCRTRKELLDRPLEDIPCVLHHDFYPARLPIPTLHAHSKNDPPILKLCAELAQEFCDPAWRVSYKHSVVHGIPRSAAEAEEMIAAMELVVSKVQHARL